LFAGRFFFQRQKRAKRIVISHVRREAVHYHTHLHDRTRKGNLVTENLGAIGRGKDGLADV
jgi:hypothetical protein